MLGPDDAGAAAAAGEARAILTEMGAVTLLRGLPAELGSAPTRGASGLDAVPTPTGDPSEAQPAPAGD